MASSRVTIRTTFGPLIGRPPLLPWDGFPRWAPGPSRWRRAAVRVRCRRRGTSPGRKPGGGTGSPAAAPRAPDFPGAGAFQQRVAGGVAFDADGVEAGGRVLDGEVEAEGVAFAGGRGGPAQRADILADDLAEAIVPLVVLAALVAAVGVQALEQLAGAGEFAGGQCAGVFQVALQVVARAARRALGAEHVGDVADRHRGDHHHLAPRAGHRHVEAALAAGLPEHAEVAPEAALAVAAEGGGETITSRSSPCTFSTFFTNTPMSSPSSLRSRSSL